MSQIQLAVDHLEAEQFAAWLNANGHEAAIGRDTGNHIDGVRTATDADASDTLNDLWAAYCDAVAARYLVRPAMAYGQPGYRDALAAADDINQRIAAHGYSDVRNRVEAEITACDPRIAADLRIEQQ